MDQGDEESLLGPNSRYKHKHIKHYEQMESWVGLVKAGTIKLVLTVFLGGALCLCLKAWEGFRSPIALSKHDVRIFNALTIAISICLGLNLLASLKRYAIILRWSILTMSWVSIEVFDLVLGIDELTNVIKLLILSVPSLRKRQWLTSTSRKWKSSKPGTNGWYALVCSIWLLANIGSQVLVASLSLFWPMQPYKCPLTQYGDVAVADMSKWIESPDADTLKNTTSLDAAWKFGMDAQFWYTSRVDQSMTDLSQLPGTPMFEGEDFWEYRFFYRNPSLLYSDYLESNRRIRTKASCLQLDINGTIEEYPDETGGYYILAKLPEQAKFTKWPIPVYGSGLITWTSTLAQTCGPRCTSLTVFQHKGRAEHNVKKSALWYCKNTVSGIENMTPKSNISLDLSDSRVNSTDEFARTAAGAIGWSGLQYRNWSKWQWRIHAQGTTWSPDVEVDTRAVEHMIMRFTIGAIAAFDDHGVRFNIHVNDEKCDEGSQQLNVGWRYISSMLGAIGLIQLGALCLLLMNANRAIVRDASYFGTAMLLKPVIDVLKDEKGVMAMSGEDIKNHPFLSGRKVRYGYKDGDSGGPRRITVSFEDEDRVHYHRRKWPSGDYS